MTIERRPGGHFRARVRRAGVDRSATFRTQREAARWERTVEAELDHGRAAFLTIDDAIARFCRSPDRRLTRHHETMLAWWRAELGPRRLVQDLRRRDFLEARARLQQRRTRSGGTPAPATVNRWLACISAVLTHCLVREEIVTNPARIGALRESAGRDRLLDPDERTRLLAACRSSSERALYPLVVTALVSACRLGELSRLTWADVDIERRLLSLIRTKNGQRRAAPIAGPAVEALLELRAHGADPAALVFAFEAVSFRAAWEAARAAARLPGLAFHTLRHTAATELLRTGASTRELQQLLGHRSVAVLSRYTHLVDDHVAELGQRVADSLFAQAAA